MIMRIVGILIVLFSIGFVVFSFISTQNYVKTEATVISVEYDPTVIYDPDDATTTDDHIVTMEYIVDGKKYTTEIRYDPHDPQSTAVGNMTLPVLIIFCAVALVVGIIIFIKA